MNFVNFSITTVRAGHVDPDRKGLGCEHDLHEALDEAGFDDLLERWHHPGVVRRQPDLQLGEELPVPEYREIRRVECPEAGVDDLADPVVLVGGGEAQAGIEARSGGFVALVATEDEVDRRQHAARVEQLDGLDPTRRVQRAAPAPPQTTLARPAPPEPDRRRVEACGIGVRTMVDERGQEVETVVGAVADEVEVVEPDRAPLLDHGIGRATDGPDPLRQLHACC